LGTLNNLGHLSQQSETTHGMVDAEIKVFRPEFRVGTGLTPASDLWLLKLIVGMRY